MSRKPRPGVCGTCGCAVVRPTPAELEAHLARSVIDSEDFTIRGHHYMHGRLDSVRCAKHEPQPCWD